MTRLVVRLLGGYRVELDGETVYGFETDKARALLAYLMVEADRPLRREILASLLWPDRPEAVARTNLRQALSAVRRALSDRNPPSFIFASPSDIQFNAASDYILDVAELESYARAHGRGTGILPESLCADFLAGFSVPDSEAFEAWVLNKQEHYHRLALEVLDDQVAGYEEGAHYDQAVAAARLQLRMEPWLEEAHRHCMRGLAMAGRTDEALHQYALCRRALEAEFGAEPSASTRALYAAIRSGKLGGELSLAHPVRRSPAPRSLAGLPPTTAGLVAREGELQQLDARLKAALDGKAQFAFVAGEPGSGKTALLEAFAVSAMDAHPDLVVAGARCNPSGHVDPLAPLRRLMAMLFGAAGSGVGWRLPGPEQERRLADSAGLSLASLRAFGPDLAGALVLDVPSARDSRPAGPLSQGALFDQLTRTLTSIARQHPLLLLIDDLHWVDDATAAYLLHLSRELSSSRSPACRVLLLGAYRSTVVSLGRRDPQSGVVSRHSMAEVLSELHQSTGEVLVDLDRADGRAFVEAVVDMEPNRLGARFRDALYAQTGGHALFTIELLRNLQGQGGLVRDEAGRWVATQALDWGRLPVKVEAAIAERIARLPEIERRILSVASVQGDDFSAEVVAEITGLLLGDILAALSGPLARQLHLVRPEGLQRGAGTRLSIYRFTHHLFQKYLYDQLDTIERAQLHAGVGTSLERRVGDDSAERERVSGLLAWHYEAGELPLPAARALLDAGRAAMRVSAFREALGHFDHGLALLARGLPLPERSSAELGEVERLLRVSRLIPLRNLLGISSLEFDGALARTAPAGAGEPQGQSRLMALEAEASRRLSRGELEAVLMLAERMLALATQAGDEDAAAHAHYWLGFARNFLGDSREAVRCFDWILTRQPPGGRAQLRASIGYDVAVHALTFSGINLWFLGHGEQARARCTRALALATELGDPYGQAFSSACGSITLFLLRDDFETLQAWCERCQRVCAEQGIAQWPTFAELFLGWLDVVHGGDRTGIERMQRAMVAWQDAGMVVGTDPIAVVLASGCLAAISRRPPGEDEERSRLVAIGLAAVQRWIGPGVPCGQSYQPELHRLRGELLLARDGLAATDEAAACFRQAAHSGREQGALSWELRAATSLVRLLRRQGDASAAEQAEARSYLAEVYGRFTEGFGFPDLREASALL